MRKSVLKIVSCIIILFIVSGCQASMHYINEGVNEYPATTPENIKIFSQRTIDKEVIEIGYVSVNITNTVDGDQLKNAIREEAALIGADAVIDFRIYGLTAGGIAVKYK